MKKILFIPLLALTLIVNSALATPADDSFSQGNQAYAEGHYPEAITAYQSVISIAGYSPNLLLNLGNAYTRAGKIGQALATYEQAHLLAPFDSEIIANESFLRTQSSLPSTDPLWLRATDHLSPNLWASLLITSLFLASLLIVLLSLKSATHRGSLKIALSLSILLTLLIASGLLISNHQLNRAWVTLSEAPVRLSPFDTAQTSFTLSDGTQVEITDHHDDYYLIRDAKGESGWLRKDQVAPLLPRGLTD